MSDATQGAASDGQTGVLRPAGLPWVRFDVNTGWKLAKTPLSRGLAGGPDIALGTPGRRPIADTEPLGSFGGRRLPRGLAIGSDGRLCAVDPDAEAPLDRVILTALASDFTAPRPAGAPPEWPFSPLWPARPLPPAPAPHDIEPPDNPPADPYTLVRPLALALAPNGDLVIADAGRDGAGRLIVLALPDGVVRRVVPMVEPVAISFDADGRACVADAGARTILRFDRHWRRETGYPHPSVPPIQGLAHIAHALRTGCGCVAGCDCDTARLPEPDLWFIAGGRVHALTRDGFLWSNGAFAFPGAGPLPAASIPEDARLTPPALTLTADGRLSWQDPAYPSRGPLPLGAPAIDRGGRLAHTGIALVARPRRVELPRSGVAQFLAIDGGREGFAWDRIALDATVPERTRLLLSTATGDAALEESQIADLPVSAWAAPLEIGPRDQPEILVQNPGGRYLWLRIEMFGDGTRTPRVSGIDVFGPRRSGLNDLPAPFREDPESAAFLDRFLSYFDTVFAEIMAQHAAVPALFDPQAVPPGEFLDWLASWFDITFLPEWPEATRRAMVAQAIAMYRRRGTIAGLRQMLQWHTGLAEPIPAIIEHFRVSQPIVIAGSPLAPTAPAHAFTIVLPAVAAPDDRARSRLDRVIAAAIPAHTRYDLRLVHPGVTIGRQSTLGVDTLVGAIQPHALGDVRLGEDAVFPAGRSALTLVPDEGEPCSC